MTKPAGIRQKHRILRGSVCREKPAIRREGHEQNHRAQPWEGWNARKEVSRFHCLNESGQQSDPPANWGQRKYGRTRVLKIKNEAKEYILKVASVFGKQLLGLTSHNDKYVHVTSPIELLHWKVWTVISNTQVDEINADLGFFFFFLLTFISSLSLLQWSQVFIRVHRWLVCEWLSPQGREGRFGWGHQLSEWCPCVHFTRGLM